MQQPDLQEAVKTLRTGGIIAYPTESIYGLGCDPRNESALHNLIALKQREHHKGLILIASNYAQITDFIGPHDERLKHRLCEPAPTPTTWVVAAADNLSPLLTGGRPTLAVRITDHPVAAALCNLFAGPITSTSANISGRTAATSAHDVRSQFPCGIDCVVDGAPGQLSRPSQIIDAQTMQVLRQ